MAPSPGSVVLLSAVLVVASAPLMPAPAVAAAAPGLSNRYETFTPARAGICGFETRGDYVHLSSSVWEASGHGWWVNINCNATTAVVTVQLQQRIDGEWRDAGTAGKATVRSGGGAGHRATGRATCHSSTVTEWRSVIDVDVVSVLDPPNTLTTGGRNIRCRQ